MSSRLSSLWANSCCNSSLPSFLVLRCLGNFFLFIVDFVDESSLLFSWTSFRFVNLTFSKNHLNLIDVFSLSVLYLIYCASHFYSFLPSAVFELDYSTFRSSNHNIRLLTCFYSNVSYYYYKLPLRTAFAVSHRSVYVVFSLSFVLK